MVHVSVSARFGLSLCSLLLVGFTALPDAQAPAPAAASASGTRIELSEGSKARYRVREQLAGISFPNDAVGETTSLKGAIVFKPDGTIDSAQSKLRVDLRTFKSDQDMRDGYIQRRTLETEQYPMAEFIPKRVDGLPHPLPSTPNAQAGFMLVGDMTLHGVTKELTWKIIATFGAKGAVAGTGSTSFPFTAFNITKPSLARIMSVDDTITLEIEFRGLRQ